MIDRARGLQSLVTTAWMLLAASVAGWACFDSSGIGPVTASIAFLPLLLPLAGLLRGSPRAYRFALLALAPALALALTEYLVNVPARPWTGATLALILVAFAGLVAALHTSPRD